MTRAELYLMLSEALAAAKPSDSAASLLAQWAVDCSHIATALAAHHKGFDRERFLQDCGFPLITIKPQLQQEHIPLLMRHIKEFGRQATLDQLRKHGAEALAKIPSNRLPELRAALLADLGEAP